MIFETFYNTMASMGPGYMSSTYKWFKMALWDAPFRIYLDLQLEYMKLKRNLSNQETAEIHEE
jgi:hypothetical protein